MCSSDCLLAIIAIIFPPLPVWVKRGLCSADSAINIALCFLGFIPGLIHSWYIISATPDYYEYERVVDVEAGPRARRRRRGDGRSRRWNIVHVHSAPQSESAPAPQSNGGNAAPRAPPRQDYGTMNNASGSNEQPQNNEVLPSYSEAIEGDHKIQRR